eukprot:m.62679 g.62679  ORF g.62679 m.62679 type:complete len:829 (-) comp11411_c0_seq6:1931-4417(-)
MSVKKSDAMMAMQQLEKLRRETNDEELIKDIDDLIEVMRSKLFTALLEIQEFFHDRIVSRRDGVTNSMRTHNQNTELEWEDAFDFTNEGGNKNRSSSSSSPHNTQHRMSTSSPQVVETVEEILINNDQGVLGLSIAGGVDRQYLDGDSSVYVTGLVPDTPSSNNGHIFVGDRILSINGTSCEKLHHKEVVDLLRKNKLLQIVVAHNALRKERMRSPSTQLQISSTIENVRVKKVNNNLGMTIAGGRGTPHVTGDESFFITKIIPNGGAFLNGSLAVGDKITHVDGVSTFSKTHEDIVHELSKPSDTVQLRIEKNAYNKAIVGLSQSLGFHDSPANQFTKTGSLMSMDTQPRQNDKMNELVVDGKNAGPIRTVVIEPSSKGLGLTIIGPSQNKQVSPNEPFGIFISGITEGKAAALSKQLHEGDQLLSVNGKDLRNAPYAEATEIMRGERNGVMTLEVQSNPEVYALYKQKMTMMQKRFAEDRQQAIQTNTSNNPTSSMVVRALFEYDPRSDTGLSNKEKKKHLLKVDYNALFVIIEARANKDWWEVENLKDNSQGWVPSPYRWTKLHGTDLTGTVLDESTEQAVKKQSSKRRLSFKFARRLSLGRKKKPKQPLALCYELVEEHEPSSENIRPVVLLGPSKDEFTDLLFSEFPELFGSCVPHTTRPPREGEVDGEDYIFTTQTRMVEGIEQGDYIEAGQYLDHLYGTSFDSLAAVAAEGRVCILDVSAHAIEHLKKRDIHPIVIFLRPATLHTVQEQNPQLQTHTARTVFDLASDVHKTFRSQFTHVITNEDVQQTYRQIVQTIRIQSKEPYWATSLSQQPLLEVMARK